MPETDDLAPDRIIIRLDPGQPIELSNLTDSFAALARFYERHYREKGDEAPKLYVTRLETGSVIAEIAPYAILFGSVIATMDSGIIVADFTNRIWRALKAFSGTPQNPSVPAEIPSRDDAADIRALVRPLTGKRGAQLGIKHARLEKVDGERRTIVEYAFDEAELNRAAINIDTALAEPGALLPVAAPSSHKPLSEVMLFFQQASRSPGKEHGRTADKGVVPDVSSEPLPVYFRKSFQDLKEKMVKGEINPLTNAFVVDVHVQYLNGEPKAYIVTDVHQVVPTDEK